jgi:hypothetical protein
MRSLVASFIAVAAFLSQPSALAELRTVVLKRKAAVRAAPDESASEVATLEEGTAIRVSHPDRDGWYSVTVRGPGKGTTGYLSADDVAVPGRVRAPGRGGKGSAEAASASGRFWFALGASIHRLSPSALQAVIGEPQSPFFAVAPVASVGYRFQPPFSLEFAFSRLSFRKGADPGEGVGYFAQATSLDVLASYELAEWGSGWLSIGAGSGVSFAKASSGTSSAELSTSLVTVPGFARLGLAQEIVPSMRILLLAAAGYRYQALKAVPVLEPAASARISTDFPLGGVYFSLSAGRRF